MNLPNTLQQSILIHTSGNHQAAVLSALNHERRQRLEPLLKLTSPSIQWFNTEAAALKIATVRDLLTTLSYTHTQQQYYCLLHADRLTIPAQNALLKSLEEPPSGITLILTSENPDQLLETIQSRCQVISISQAGAHANKVGDGDETDSQEELTNNALQLLQKIPTLRYGELIDATTSYTDPTTAKKVLLKLLQECEFARQSKLADENVRSTKARSYVLAEQILLSRLNVLAMNCNASLVLEDTFFQLKKALATPNNKES